MESLQSYGSESEEEEAAVEEKSDVTAIEGNVKTRLGSQSRSQQTSDNSASAVDYFNLNDDSDDSDCAAPEIKKRRECVIETKEGEVSLPQGDFWDSFTEEDAKKCLSTKYEPDRSQGSKESLSTKRPFYKHFTVQKKSVNDTSSNSAVNSPLESSNKGHYAKRQFCYIHSKIAPHLSKNTVISKCPGRKEKCIKAAHSGVINRVKWNVVNYSHLFLSASMDGSVKIWNIWSQLDPCLQTLSVHSKAVKDAVWSACGRKILSCSYDRTAAISDVESGIGI